MQTDEEIDDYIKNALHTANALVGTCVHRVRVADSSVIPIIPGGQTATPTVMVADRAASFIMAPQVEAEIELNEIRGEEEEVAAMA